MADTAQIILGWLREMAVHSIDLKITADTELIEQGVLDSLQILNLVGFIEEKFGVTLPVEEFVPENFKTAVTIAATVERLGLGSTRPVGRTA